MSCEEHLSVLKQGYKVWERWRFENPQVRPQLYAVDLHDLDLSHYNFDGVNFNKTNFIGANLTKAKLNNALFLEANLSNTILRNAELEGADLTRAIIRSSDLSGSKLYKACLSGAIMSNSNISQVDLRGADLSGALLDSVNLNNSCLSRAILNKTNLSNSDLNNTFLDYANFVDVNLSDSRITNCYIYGISTWGLKLDGAIQSDLVITHDGNPFITVDNIEVAQFIYLLLNNSKIRDVINTITSKVVLILGRFTSERKAILDTIRAELSKRNYTPVLFDFEKPDDRNFIETVSTLAHMARFVIADFTEPKIVLQEAQHIVPNIAIPFVPIFLNNSNFEPITLYDLRKGRTTVLDTFRYNDINHLLENLEENIIKPAETLAGKLNMDNPIK